jgi:hypothetical protein
MRSRQNRDDLLNALAMGEKFTQFRRDGRRWIGTIQPRERGMSFIVEIDTSWTPPRVQILDPKLVNEPGKPVPPHHYIRGRQVCLFHPDDPGWDSARPIAFTTVPWTFEWCYYYELWLDTGVWYGPEYEHAEPNGDARAGDDRDAA